MLRNCEHLNSYKKVDPFHGSRTEQGLATDGRSNNMKVFVWKISSFDGNRINAQKSQSHNHYIKNVIVLCNIVFINLQNDFKREIAPNNKVTMILDLHL